MRKRSRSRAAVPLGWQTKPLGSAVDRVTTRNQTGNQNVLTISAHEGLISQKEFFSRRVASEELDGYFLLRRGDFAYNKSYSAGFPVGVIRRLERYADGIVSPLYICFRPASAEVDAEFLRHYCAAGLLDDDIAWIAKEGVRNHGLLNVGVEDFFSVDLDLPPPPEQRRIAEILGTVDTAICKTEQLITKLQQVKQGLLHDLLSRGIDDSGEVRDPERHPEQFKDSPGGTTPREWTTTTLGGVASVSSGTTPARSQSRYWIGGTIPWVKTGEVKFTAIRTTEESVTESALSETTLRLYPPGTVLVAMYGQGATRGRSAILAAAATTNQACAAIQPDPSKLTAQFLFVCLKARYEQLRSLGHGSHQTNLSAALLAKAPLVLPPLAEQLRMVTILEAHDARVAAADHALQKLLRLKYGLAEDLLTGRVRVIKLLDEAAA